MCVCALNALSRHGGEKGATKKVECFSQFYCLGFSIFNFRCVRFPTFASGFVRVQVENVVVCCLPIFMTNASYFMPLWRFKRQMAHRRKAVLVECFIATVSRCLSFQLEYRETVLLREDDTRRFESKGMCSSKTIEKWSRSYVFSSTVTRWRKVRNLSL